MKVNDLLKQYRNGNRYFLGADLYGADLTGADLHWADLHEANLHWADLHEANLHWANLRKANLTGADLHGADLRWADLAGADLTGADLTGADLTEADLVGADLTGADLSDTCLDPMNTPNGDCGGFELIDNGRWVIAYRTAYSPVAATNRYRVGEEYTAPWFSVSDTECHPGLYVSPNKKSLEKFLVKQNRTREPIIRVIFRPWDCHRAGSQYRVRSFIVWSLI